MPNPFREFEIVREGDPSGNRMIVRLVTPGGKTVHAIAVPQDSSTRTGPTWAYLFENEGLTLIDAGAVGSYPALAEGIEAVGYSVTDLSRVIVTHGHQDHDGAIGQLQQTSNVQLWAHGIYPHLQQYDPRDIQRRPASPLQREMDRVGRENTEPSSPDGQAEREVYRSRHHHYVEGRRAYRVGHGITDGERIGDLTFMSAPGHSPDELCVRMDGVVFTGDHVLPEITPHPTTKARYEPRVSDGLPAEYRNEDDYYGLERYLRSLKLVTDLGPDVVVLPAHRLYNRSTFNFETTPRAQDVIDHHADRLARIVRRIGPGPTRLEDLTRGIFARSKLVGGNLYAALSEVVAHIELLQDTGDVRLDDANRLRATGSENHRVLIAEVSV